MNITKTKAKNVLKIVRAGLRKGGNGDPTPGNMCVEQAVCIGLGLPFSDNPECVDSVYRSFKIRLNDANWSSNKTRAKGMERSALVQLGSKGTIDSEALRLGLVKLAQGKWLPKIMRMIADKYENKEEIIEAALLCEQDPNSVNCISAEKLLRKTAAYAADAADAAYAAAAADAAAADARDKFLAEAAEDGVQLMVSLGAPGAKWLELAPLGGTISGRD